jgi:hypothetical protein
MQEGMIVGLLYHISGLSNGRRCGRGHTVEGRLEEAGKHIRWRQGVWSMPLFNHHISTLRIPCTRLRCVRATQSRGFVHSYPGNESTTPRSRFLGRWAQRMNRGPSFTGLYDEQRYCIVKLETDARFPSLLIDRHEDKVISHCCL